MGSWQFDSNRGRQIWVQDWFPQNQQEKQKVDEHADNQISGNAGTGLTYAATDGGVQRTHNPSLVYTQNRQKDLPPTVSTGRGVEPSQYEMSLMESLKNISGTAKNEIYNKFTGLQDRLTQEATLGSYQAKQADINKYFSSLLGGTSTIDDIKKDLQKSASAKARSLYSSIIDPLNKEYEKYKSSQDELQTLYDALGFSNISDIDLSRLTGKARSGQQEELARLRQAGVLDDITLAETLLGQTQEQEDESGVLLEALSNKLLGERANFGTSEVGSLGESLSKDVTRYKTLVDLVDKLNLNIGNLGDLSSMTAKQIENLTPGTRSKELQDLLNYKYELRDILKKYGMKESPYFE